MSKLTPLLIILVIGLLLGSLFVFTVDEKETAIKFKFGEIVQAGYEPGLHWRIPVIHTIKKFNTRIQTLDNNPEPVLNTDNEYLMVDYFVKWKIKSVREFYITNEGSLERASANLNGVMKNALLQEFSKRTLEQVITTQRIELMDNLQAQTKEIAENYGMEIVDVRIKQINLADAVSNSVYDRMRSERSAEAAEHRSNGRKEAINIEANTDKQISIMLAEAEERSAIIRGNGDAEAARLYAESYNKNPEFYAFYRSLQAYVNSFASSNGNMMVLDPKSEFFKYFNDRLNSN